MLTMPTVPERYVLDLRDLTTAHAAVAGGKGANLGELSRLDGISVPAGFCVTTEAFRRTIVEAPSIDDRLDQLSQLRVGEREAIGALSGEIRRMLEALPLPGEVSQAITAALARGGEHTSYAVRSSATAEDLPTASFAGQQDTYLNIVGAEAILRHVSRCWASLFTDRAVTYRLRNAIDHRQVQMAVIVQQMVFPQVSGVLFTADPVTSNRKVASVEAGLGLGEALASGLVNPDVYRVRDGGIVAKTIATKERAVLPTRHGGTQQQPVEGAMQRQPALTDAQVIQLERLGRRIEAHFGGPQDIEWCLAGDTFHVVQSRPITTLFPVPQVDDDANRVYLSVGHQQMMTDAIKPLGLSVWHLTALRPMVDAGGRLFVDVTSALAAPAARAGLLELIGRSDPLMRDALDTVIDRGDFLPAPPALPAEDTSAPPAASPPAPIDADPGIVTDLIERTVRSIAALERDIRTTSGSARFDFILADLAELQRMLRDPQSHQVVMAGIEATWWINDHLQSWLGEKNAADVLTQSVPHNVTSEMGLALLDVADAIRPHPDVVAFLSQVDDDGFLGELDGVAGGPQARAAIEAWLAKYGMRCVGEIDITRPRWRERPSTLLPVILGHVKNVEPGEAERRFEQGRQAAHAKEHELLARVRALPDGERKADETKQMIDRVRTFIGYRELPKYNMISRYAVYKQALLEEAERLEQAGVLGDVDDIFYLTFQELHEVVRTHQLDEELLARRRDAFRTHQALAPPRVLTSEGEALTGTYHRDDVPPGALIGLPVSAGTVEGRARVIRDMAEAELEPGDILVTAHTDPSWSPLFVSVAGLVTEVGGVMTHGAVIAREYGLPAVVGVKGATQLIPDGRRLRVNGAEGYVELLA